MITSKTNQDFQTQNKGPKKKKKGHNTQQQTKKDPRKQKQQCKLTTETINLKSNISKTQIQPFIIYNLYYLV